MFPELNRAEVKRLAFDIIPREIKDGDCPHRAQRKRIADALQSQY